MPVCTVIGFPNGYNTTAVKVFETEDAVRNGAEEIDMVINLGWVKEGRYDLVREEIQAVKKACNGKLLKVIIETCCSRRKRRSRCAEQSQNQMRSISRHLQAFQPMGQHLKM